MNQAATQTHEGLRVGFFTEVYRPIVNGVVASIDTLATGLRGRGHRVYCFAPHMPGADEDEAVLRMPSLPLPTSSAYRLTLPLVSRRNRKGVLERLSLIHVHSPFVTGWMGARYARRYGLPLVYTYHTQLEAYAHYVPFEPNATRYAATRLTRAFANMADAVIVPTSTMARHLRASGVTARLEVVPSAIDVQRFGAGRRDEALRETLGAGRDDCLLLCVSRLAKEKNIEVLLEAMRIAGGRSLRLVIAGDGPARSELERRARECGIAQRISFLGAVPHDRLPDLYASCDAFCMPSTTETQGLVQAEALAAGAWVIAADAPQNRDVLLDAGNLVAATAQAFAEAFLAVPADRGPDEVAAARAHAQRFSIDRQLDRVLSLYADLLAKRNPLDSEHMFA